MKWVRSSDYSIKTPDGRMHICRALVGGDEIFTLWDARKPKGEFGQERSVGNYPSASEAKAAALIHRGWSVEDYEADQTKDQ